MFTLKSNNQSEPFAWMLEGTDLSTIEDAKRFVEDVARTKLSAENYSEQDDDELFAEWQGATYEYEEAVDYIREQINAHVSESLTAIEHAGVTFQDDYTPDCPICGMNPEFHPADGELSYSCGHFVDVYNAWADGVRDEDRWEMARFSTHVIVTNHQLGGTAEWFFDRKSEQLNAVMTSTEIAQRYGIDDSGVRHMILRGSLRGRKAGNAWLVLRSDAEERWGDRPAALYMVSGSKGTWAYVEFQRGGYVEIDTVRGSADASDVPGATRSAQAWVDWLTDLDDSKLTILNYADLKRVDETEDDLLAYVGASE